MTNIQGAMARPAAPEGLRVVEQFHSPAGPLGLAHYALVDYDSWAAMPDEVRPHAVVGEGRRFVILERLPGSAD
jgi:hypothetical protein